jgi:hypothetical protein
MRLSVRISGNARHTRVILWIVMSVHIVVYASATCLILYMCNKQ